MGIRQVGCVLLAAMLVSSGAAAHGDGKHGGAMIEGAIEEVSTESFTIETQTGLVPVTLTGKSQIVSEEKKTLGRDSLKPGIHVMVGGHKLPGGGLSAVEVMVNGEPSSRDGGEPGQRQ